MAEKHDKAEADKTSDNDVNKLYTEEEVQYEQDLYDTLDILFQIQMNPIEKTFKTRFKGTKIS